MGEAGTFEITHLGAQGDGTADESGKPVHIPFALPGETIRASGKGARKTLDQVINESDERIEPFCNHFGRCGGCQLQHLSDEAYVVWKTSLMVQAFARESIDAQSEPMVRFNRASRRRAVLTARLEASAPLLGFAERGSNRLVDVEHCPIMVEPINAALPTLRDLVSAFKPVRNDIRIYLLATDNGMDLAFSFDGKSPKGIVRLVTTHAAAGYFSRITINGETVLERLRPVMRVGQASISPPPGAFVQASAAAEQAMAELVTGHLTGCKRVADLFSGFGTFALRLAENSIVHAAESEGAALAALDRAWRETGGALKAVTHEKRDLFRRPMMAKELKPYQGVVFDPPRAGAEAQAAQLANSNVRKIAAVSCNPASLARDLRILIEGGYKLESVTPIDQFAFTPHLEVVALLSR